MSNAAIHLSTTLALSTPSTRLQPKAVHLALVADSLPHGHTSDARSPQPAARSRSPCAVRFQTSYRLLTHFHLYLASNPSDPSTHQHQVLVDSSFKNKLIMAKRKQRSKPKRGPSSCSLEGVDCNAMIFTANKTDRKKRMNKEKATTKEYPNQSKSQQRKLKKLEEEKEKAYMFSKAQENLEKYKISTGLYNVLEASKDIGKAKIRREKRRNAVLFSKEGLEDPQSDRARKKRH